MEVLYWLLFALCAVLTVSLGLIKCSSSIWLSGFMLFLTAYVGLIILDSQPFYISPSLYFILLSICFLPGPLILGYVSHISTRKEVSFKDFVLCLLPILMVPICHEQLGGYSLWETVPEAAYKTAPYQSLFGLISAMAGIHLLAYLGKAFVTIVQMRRDWTSYQSQTLPESWYDMIKVLLVMFVANLTQVYSAFLHPTGESVSIGDIGFLSLIGYFIYLAVRTAARNRKGEEDDGDIIWDSAAYLTNAVISEPEPLSTDEYSKCAAHIEHQIQDQKLYLQEDLSLTSLATQLEMPSHRVSEVLNHHFEKNFYEYINDLRIQYAAELLLKDPKRSITEIYYTAGFTTKSTFYGRFKKQFGCTPSEYRKLEDLELSQQPS